jgi:oligopeptide transport system permease protein
MSTALAPDLSTPQTTSSAADSPLASPPETLWRHILRSRRAIVGGSILIAMFILCTVTLPWTLHAGANGISRYQAINEKHIRHPPNFESPEGWFGYDNLGRSVLVRCLVGGTLSLAVGLAAAAIAVILGVIVGLVAGYRGGMTDAALMRIVDILYGLPYILLVILFKVAFEQPLTGLRWSTLAGTLLLLAAALCIGWALTQSTGGLVGWAIGAAVLLGTAATLHATTKARLSDESANIVVLFLAIGLVSWLTMSRVIRGQVLSLRGQPFIEACRALGLKQGHIFSRHILPNLVGPITVYATLTVPSAILQESFLSFLGVGVSEPMATWGSLASKGVEQLTPLKFYWWQLLFPCTLLAITLLSLNFLGDGLRDVFDPKKEAAKI